MDLGTLIVEQIRNILNEELSNIKVETFVGTVIDVKDSNTVVVFYNNKASEIKVNNIVLQKGKTVHIIHPAGDIRHKAILEDICSVKIDLSNTVTSVDGMTGNVVLTNYVKKTDTIPTDKLVSNDNTLILDGDFL